MKARENPADSHSATAARYPDANRVPLSRRSPDSTPPEGRIGQNATTRTGYMIGDCPGVHRSVCGRDASANLGVVIRGWRHCLPAASAVVQGAGNPPIRSRARPPQRWWVARATAGFLDDPRDDAGCHACQSPQIGLHRVSRMRSTLGGPWPARRRFPVRAGLRLTVCGASL
jgi:hypothetical protein